MNYTSEQLICKNREKKVHTKSQIRTHTPTSTMRHFHHFSTGPLIEIQHFLTGICE